MCEVVSCGDAHPGVSGGRQLLLTGLAVVTARETEGAVDGSVVVELVDARQAAGEVVEGAGVGWGQAGTVAAAPLGEWPRRQRALILHRQLLLDQVS